MEKLTIIQVSKEELQQMIEDAFIKIAAKLPKRRTKPYTKKEVHDLFSVTYPTIMRWEGKGYLDRISVGGRVYYSVDSVEKYREKR